MDERIKLSDAYALKSPADNRALYARWADSYDSDFAEGHRYDYHNTLSAAYLTAGGATVNVLDVGCGTGLVGESLASAGVSAIHGMDISPAMLAKAMEKVNSAGAAVYHSLHEADLTASVDIPDNSFAGVVSAGAFTHGHLGPESLDEVVRMAAPGALLAIGVNAELFGSEGGFGDWLTGAEDDGQITGSRTQSVAVYAGGDLGAVGADELSPGNARSTVMMFRKV